MEDSATAARGAGRRASLPVVTAATLAAALAAMLTAVTAHGAPFTVTNNDDSGDGSLRDAIAAADANAEADTITFAPSVTGTIDLTSGPLQIDSPDGVQIIGPGARTLEVLGTPGRVLRVVAGAQATVSGLTIAGGSITGSGGNAVGGAGGNGTNGTTVPGPPGGAGGNAAGGDGGDITGGGILNSGELTLVDVTVRDNTAVAGAGGNATGGDGGDGGDGGTSITGAGGAGGPGGNATGGDGGDGLGGGIFNDGLLTLDGVTLRDNDVVGGPGGSATGGAGGDGGDTGTSGAAGGVGGPGGSATAGDGGAASGAGLYNAGSLEVVNTTVSGNTATPASSGGSATGGSGGAGGAGPAGGAGGNGGSATGGLTFTAPVGGGIANAAGGGADDLTSLTLAFNAAPIGANFAGDTARFLNSIVSDPGGGGDNCESPNADSQGHNLEDGASCGFDDLDDEPNADPRLDPLAANGGPTDTHELDDSSDAIDEGTSDSLSAPGTLDDDQRGRDRTVDLAPPNADDGTDIGAFEIQGPPGRCAGVQATIAGEGDGDLIVGTPGPDVIVGTAGDDVIRGRGGRDLVCARRGNDHVSGGARGDELRGGAGGDTLHGRRGGDDLRGQSGDDTLRGNQGNDDLRGGAGVDDCAGGTGNDTKRGCEH